MYCFGSHPGSGQLLNLLNLHVGQELQVAHDVGTVPLILLFHGLHEELRVPVTVLVATEQAAAPRLVLVSTSGK